MRDRVRRLAEATRNGIARLFGRRGATGTPVRVVSTQSAPAAATSPQTRAGRAAPRARVVYSGDE